METEAVKYDPSIESSTKSTTDVPIVKTETRTVTYSNDGGDEVEDPGYLVSAHAHSSRSQTIETTTVSYTEWGLAWEGRVTVAILAKHISVCVCLYRPVQNTSQDKRIIYYYLLQYRDICDLPQPLPYY